MLLIYTTLVPGTPYSPPIRLAGVYGELQAFRLGWIPNTVTGGEISLDGSQNGINWIVGAVIPPTILLSAGVAYGSCGPYSYIRIGLIGFAGTGVAVTLAGERAGLCNLIAESALTANYNNGNPVTVFTPTSTAGLRISFSQAIVVADATGSTLPSLTLAWTDVAGTARTKTLINTSTANTTGLEADGMVLIYPGPTGLVTLTSVGYASNTTGEMTYTLAVAVELLDA